jgi:hypothetical protein
MEKKGGSSDGGSFPGSHFNLVFSLLKFTIRFSVNSAEHTSKILGLTLWQNKIRTITNTERPKGRHLVKHHTDTAQQRRALTYPNSARKVKVKFILEKAMNAQKGSGDKLYFFFNFGARLGCMVNAAPWPLYPWETEQVGLHGQSEQVRKFRTRLNSIT